MTTDRRRAVRLDAAAGTIGSIPRVTRRLVAVPLAALVLLMTLAGTASAHTGNQTYLYLDVEQSSLAGRIEAPMADMLVALDMDGIEESQWWPTLEQSQDEINEYLNQHFSLGTGDQAWPITFDDISLFFSDETEENDNYIVIPFDVTVGGDVPRQFDVNFDPFVDEIPGRDSLLLIANDWETGIVDNGWESLTTFGADSRSQEVDLGEPSWWKNFESSIELGVNHIRTGPDHILFVLVLLLPSVLVFTTRWHPTTGFVASLWRVLKIVTMFTVAHSITFTLAGLDLLPLPPSKLVEFIIALSIAAAALHNIRPIFPNKEWLLSFSFGLFHGMGFASLVEGLDVSRSTQLVSLLGRNVGIELGQALVVLLLFPALFLLRRTRFYQPLFVASSVIMSVVALVWMVERLAETDLGISAIVDPVFTFPRVVYYIAGFTALATAAFLVERNNRRLLPTYDVIDVDAGLGRVDEASTMVG